MNEYLKSQLTKDFTEIFTINVTLIEVKKLKPGDVTSKTLVIVDEGDQII